MIITYINMTLKLKIDWYLSADSWLDVGNDESGIGSVKFDLFTSAGSSPVKTNHYSVI